MKNILPLSLSALLLASCTLGPDFAGARAPELPATWVNALPPGSDKHTLEEWWHCFRDPQLTRLIEGGFAANPDMVSAALAIEKAQSALRATQSSLFPTLGLSAGGSNSGNFDISTSHGTAVGYEGFHSKGSVAAYERQNAADTTMAHATAAGFSSCMANPFSQPALRGRR